jgi:hypothetical protein
MEDLQIGVEGLNYIPEDLRGPILQANQAYLEVAHEANLL